MQQPLETVPEVDTAVNAVPQSEEVEVDSQQSQSAAPMQMSDLEGTPSATELSAEVSNVPQTNPTSSPTSQSMLSQTGVNTNAQPFVSSLSSLGPMPGSEVQFNGIPASGMPAQQYQTPSPQQATAQMGNGVQVSPVDRQMAGQNGQVVNSQQGLQAQQLHQQTLQQQIQQQQMLQHLNMQQQQLYQNQSTQQPQQQAQYFGVQGFQGLPVQQTQGLQHKPMPVQAKGCSGHAGSQSSSYNFIRSSLSGPGGFGTGFNPVQMQQSPPNMQPVGFGAQVQAPMTNVSPQMVQQTGFGVAAMQPPMNNSPVAGFGTASMQVPMTNVSPVPGSVNFQSPVGVATPAMMQQSGLQISPPNVKQLVDKSRLLEGTEHWTERDRQISALVLQAMRNAQPQSPVQLPLPPSPVTFQAIQAMIDAQNECNGQQGQHGGAVSPVWDPLVPTPSMGPQIPDQLQHGQLGSGNVQQVKMPAETVQGQQDLLTGPLPANFVVVSKKEKLKNHQALVKYIADEVRMMPNVDSESSEALLKEIFQKFHNEHPELLQYQSFLKTVRSRFEGSSHLVNRFDAAYKCEQVLVLQKAHQFEIEQYRKNLMLDGQESSPVDCTDIWNAFEKEFLNVHDIDWTILHKSLYGHPDCVQRASETFRQYVQRCVRKFDTEIAQSLLSPPVQSFWANRCFAGMFAFDKGYLLEADPGIVDPQQCHNWKLETIVTAMNAVEITPMFKHQKETAKKLNTLKGSGGGGGNSSLKAGSINSITNLSKRPGEAREFFKSSNLPYGAYGKLTDPQKLVADQIMETHWEKWRNNTLDMKPAGNGQYYYLKDGRPCLCFKNPNADPKIKSCARNGEAKGGHLIQQCVLNGTTNVAPNANSKNGKTGRAKANNAVNSQVSVVNSKGEIIQGEALAQSLRDRAKNAAALKNGQDSPPKKTRKQKQADDKASEAKKAASSAKASKEAAKVSALVDLAKVVTSWGDGDMDPDEKQKLDKIKATLNNLTLPIRCKTIVVNLQSDGPSVDADGYSAMSCVVNFVHFHKMLVDSGAKHNVGSRAFGEWCIENDFADEFQVKCDNLRFEAASGDVMPYVADLVVRIKIGKHVVNTLWKIMATMPDGHLPILGIRGQRCMNGDILNSIGQFRTCVSNEVVSHDIEYGDGDWSPEKEVLAAVKQSQPDQILVEELKLSKVQIKQLEDKISELEKGNCIDVDPSGGVGDTPLNDRVMNSSCTSKTNGLLAYQWDNVLMVTAVVLTSCAMASLLICNSLLAGVATAEDVVLADVSVDNRLNHHGGYHVAAVIDGCSEVGVDFNTMENVSLVSWCAQNKIEDVDWAATSSVSRPANLLNLNGSQYLDAELTSSGQMEDQPVLQANVSNVFGEIVAIAVGNVQEYVDVGEDDMEFFDCDDGDGGSEVLQVSKYEPLFSQTMIQQSEQERKIELSFLADQEKLKVAAIDDSQFQIVKLERQRKKDAAKYERLQRPWHVKVKHDQKLPVKKEGYVKSSSKPIKLDCPSNLCVEGEMKRRKRGAIFDRSWKFSELEADYVDRVLTVKTVITNQVEYESQRNPHPHLFTPRQGVRMAFKLSGKTQAGTIYQNLRKSEMQQDGSFKDTNLAESWRVQKEGSRRKFPDGRWDSFLVTDAMRNAADGEIQIECDAWFEKGSTDPAFKRQPDTEFGYLRGKLDHQRKIPSNTQVLSRSATVSWKKGGELVWKLPIGKLRVTQKRVKIAKPPKKRPWFVSEGHAAKPAVSSKSGMDHRFKNPRKAQQRRLEAVTDARMRRKRNPSEADWDWKCEAGVDSDEEQELQLKQMKQLEGAALGASNEWKKLQGAAKEAASEYKGFAEVQARYEAGEMSDLQYESELTKVFDADYGTEPAAKQTVKQKPKLSVKQFFKKKTKKKPLKLKRKPFPVRPEVTPSAPVHVDADAGAKFFSREFVMDKDGFFSEEDKASLMKLSELNRWKVLIERFDRKEKLDRQAKLKGLADKIAVVRSKCQRRVAAVGLAKRADGTEIDSVLQPGLCDLFKFDTQSVSYIHEGRTAQSVLDAGDSVFAKAGIAESEWANRPENKGVLEDAFRDYSSVFEPSPDGLLKRALNEDGSRYEATIHLKHDKPVRSPKYTLSPVMLEIVRNGVLEMEALGVVRRQYSPYSANCLPVAKPGTDPVEWRIVTDLRDCNENVVDNCYPAPTLFDVHHKLYGMKRFSSIDLKKFYWQITLDEASRLCTGFHVPGLGSFVYEVMPMGIKPSCAIGQSLAEDVLREVYDGPGPMHGKPGLGNFVIVWSDDILIFDQDTPYHSHYVAWVLKRLKKRNIQASLPKAKFGVEKIGFVGHFLDAEGLHADPAKVKSVQSMEVPKDAAAVRRVLGMCQYLSKFIKDYAQLSAPMSDLLSDGEKFEMTPVRLKSFESLKKAITEAPVLALPDFSRRFIIRCDASDRSIGGSLNQVDDDGWRRPICYMGRKCRNAELNYGIRDKECLAMVYCLRKCREYIQGKTDTVVCSDHKNLLFLKKAMPEDRRLFNAACELSCIPFTLVHVPGETLCDADAISRACTEEEEAQSGDDDVNGETKVLSLDDVEVVPTMEQAKHLVGVERSTVGAVAVGDLQISLKTAAAVVKKIEVNRNTLRRVKMADCVSQFRHAKDLMSYGKVLQNAVVELYPRFVDLRKELTVATIKKPRSNTARVELKKQKHALELVEDLLRVYESDCGVTGSFVGQRKLGGLTVAAEQPGLDGRYNVFVANVGLNSIGQAAEGSEFKVVGGTTANRRLAALFERQTGVAVTQSTQQFLTSSLRISTQELPKIHVLTTNVALDAMPTAVDEKPDFSSVTAGDLTVKFAEVHKLTELLKPQIVICQFPPTDGLNPESVARLDALITGFDAAGYDTADDILNAAEHGDYVSKFVGVMVAVKRNEGVKLPSFVFPESLKRFAGLESVLTSTVHPRLESKHYQTVPKQDHGLFEPMRVGTVTRAASAPETQGLFEMSHPLPEISPIYEWGGTNGAQWVLQNGKARLLTHEEMSSCLNFNSVTKAWLMNENKYDAQRYIAAEVPVSLCVRLLEAVLPRLQSVTAQANSPLGMAAELAVVHAFATTEVQGRGLPATEEVNEFRSAYHYVGAMVNHEFPSLQRIREEQHRQKDIKDVIDFLKLSDEEKRAAKQDLAGHYSREKDLRYMKVVKDVLFFSNEYGTGEVMTDAVVMPKTLIQSVLKALHDSPFYGHAGMRATLFAVKEKCYWNPHMVRDIRSYVKNCCECRKSKAFRRAHGGLQKRQFYWCRHECCGIDMVGSFIPVNGMKWVCHVTDFATGFNFCFPLPNKDAVTVAAGLHKNVFMFAGWPRRLVSDQGGEFCNKLAEELASKYGYAHLRTCSFSPQGNSATETRHRHMNAMFRIACRKYKKNWVDGLVYITWCLNTRPYRDTEFSPYHLYFGQKPPTLADAALDEDLAESVGLDYKQFLSPEQWLRNMEIAMRDALVITNHARMATAHLNATADEKLRVIHHAPGSLVNVSRPITKKGQTSRLLYQTIGPFEVMEHASPANTDGSYNVFKLKHLSTGKEQSFNVRDIVPFISKEAYEKVLVEEQEEEKAEDEEVCSNDNFDPQPGDFCLFPNFQDVPYHLVRCVSRPFPDAMMMNYYGVSKHNKKRLKNFAKVWTHDSKPEVQTNGECKRVGYAAEEHYLPLESLCQKVIVPVSYMTKGQPLFKLKAADVKDVLKYKSLV